MASFSRNKTLIGGDVSFIDTEHIAFYLVLRFIKTQKGNYPQIHLLGPRDIRYISYELIFVSREEKVKLTKYLSKPILAFQLKWRSLRQTKTQLTLATHSVTCWLTCSSSGQIHTSEFLTGSSKVGFLSDQRKYF